MKIKIDPNKPHTPLSDEEFKNILDKSFIDKKGDITNADMVKLRKMIEEWGEQND